MLSSDFPFHLYRHLLYSIVIIFIIILYLSENKKHSPISSRFTHTNKASKLPFSQQLTSPILYILSILTTYFSRLSLRYLAL